MKQEKQLNIFIAPSESTTTEFHEILNPHIINEDKIIPIHLYVKQHSATKLLYFGMTQGEDPVKYTGSGLYWTNHYKKHGGKKFIKTLCVWTFNCQKDATEFALSFSEDNNIVESKQWANLIPENAIQGGTPKGWKSSPETRKKLSDIQQNKSPEEKAEIAQKKRDAKKGLRLYDKPGENPKMFKEQPEDPTWVLRVTLTSKELKDLGYPLYDHPSKQSKRFQYQSEDSTWILRK